MAVSFETEKRVLSDPLQVKQSGLKETIYNFAVSVFSTFKALFTRSSHLVVTAEISHPIECLNTELFETNLTKLRSDVLSFIIEIDTRKEHLEELNKKRSRVIDAKEKLIKKIKNEVIPRIIFNLEDELRKIEDEINSLDKEIAKVISQNRSYFNFKLAFYDMTYENLSQWVKQKYQVTEEDLFETYDKQLEQVNGLLKRADSEIKGAMEAEPQAGKL